MSDAFNAGNPSDTSTALDTLVGEGKKFGDNEALAKGKLESDTHITNLETQLVELKEELGKNLTASEVLEEIRKSTATPAAPPQAEHTSSGLSEDDVTALVDKTLESRHSEAGKAANLNAVNAALGVKYGDKSSGHIASKATELGVSVKFLQSVAESSPKAFYSTIGFDAAITPTPNLTLGGENTEVNPNPVGGTPKDGTKAHYDAIKAKDKRLYFSPVVQKRLFEDRKRLGTAFYS